MRVAALILCACLLAPAAADPPQRPAPGHPFEGWWGQVALRRCALDEAIQAFEAILERDPLHPGALAGLGEVHVKEGRPAEALGRAEQALLTRQGRTSAAVWRLKAHALIELRAQDAALEPARRAVALGPGDPRNAEVLARALYRNGDMEGSGALLARAVALGPRTEEANLRLGSGFGPPVEDTPWRDGPLASTFEAALADWRDGAYRRALDAFLALCLERPHVYKFRVCAGLLLREMRRRGEQRFGGAPERVYALAPAPDIEGLEAFVPGYDDLDPVAAHALRVAVAPARRWMPGLLEAGATHAIMPLDVSLAEVVGGIQGVRTFDGRLYEHLRGVGGLHAASGVERLHAAARFAYHLFAHEFAHQVLRYAFPEDLQAEVEVLFEAAVDTDRCLDWYAAANADEYFAQGYEAFVSHAKRGCLKETQRHTRAELAARDPAFHAFLEAHLDVSYESDEAMRPFRRAVEEARRGR